MTLEHEKRLALLAALLHIGGVGAKARVLDAIVGLNLLRLSDDDKQVMKNRKEIKWRNDLAFVRKHLVQAGYMSDQRFNNWEITASGRAYAATLALQAKLQSGRYVNLLTATTVVAKALGPAISDTAAVDKQTTSEEGARHLTWAVQYERDPVLRKSAIEFHGVRCMACKFSFELVYGAIGRGFIEVHHLNPISALGGPGQVDPKFDLVVLCSNCHSIVHRRKDKPLSLDELLELIGSVKGET